MIKLFSTIRKYYYNRNSSRSDFSPDFIRTNDYFVARRTIKKARKEWQEYVKSIPAYPNSFSGKGIVICAGGYVYVTCAWVNINMLRQTGCTLDIELWYNGTEINDQMIINFEKLGVSCKNCSTYTQDAPNGYEMKPFAILHSSFNEVLFLDADNNCIKDPTYLFQSSEYLRTGTLFWPDAWTTSKSNPIWKIVDSTDFNSREQESGQILINKEKCWKELNLCMFFNKRKRFYHNFLLGDKDTFKFAWTALKSPYYMIQTNFDFCGFQDSTDNFFGFSMIQHDPQGEAVFIHRNLIKWAQTKNDEVLMTHIKKIKSQKDVTFDFKFVHVHGSPQPFCDIKGDVEILSFQELFSDYELRCLEILKELRNADFYASFLVHQGFIMTRPGYVQDPLHLWLG